MCWRNRDEEESISTHYDTGYPRFSRFLNSDPERFLMVFKRFDRLAIQNLVYLQSELQVLQEKLDGLFDADFKNSGPDAYLRKNCLRSWSEFEDAVQSGNNEERERMRLIFKIRRKLRTYRENTSDPQVFKLI